MRLGDLLRRLLPWRREEDDRPQAIRFLDRRTNPDGPNLGRRATDRPRSQGGQPGD